jgi:hypothetical protein
MRDTHPMRPPAAAFAAAAAATLACAAPAGAAELWRTTRLDGGPFASGAGAGWTEGVSRHSEDEMDTTDRYDETLYLVTPGGTPLPFAFGARIRTPTFSDSATRVTVEGDVAIATTTTRSGVPGVAENSSSSTRVHDLARNRAVPDVCGVYAATGPVLVYLRCSGGAVVRDLATEQQATPPDLGRAVAVAGSQLAIRRADGSVHVFDWTTGVERYAVALPAGPIAVAVDGTVIANTAGLGCTGRPLVRASVADPVARPLALTACSDWLAVSGAQLVYRAAQGAVARYAVAALDGSAPRDVAVVAAQQAERGTAHVDGDGLAYAVQACDRSIAIHRVSLTQAEREPAADVRCAGAVTRARLTARHVRVSVRCPTGCQGTLRVRPPGHAALAARKLTIAAGTRTFAVRAGRVTRRRLARAGRVQVTLTTAALDGSAATSARTLSLR